MKHVGIEIKFYNLDTFKKQIDVNFIDLDSELVDLNYKVASLIFCHFWRSIAPLLSGRGHVFAVASVLFIWHFTSIKRPANYLSKRNGDR